MSPRFSDDELRGLRHDMEGLDSLGEFTIRNCVMLSMVTELLALRAEVERLRKVEKAARELVSHTSGAAWCTFCAYVNHHEAGCKVGNLHAALDANKQEPTT